MKDNDTIAPEKIAQYYDANTSKFLRFGGAGQTTAIHRAIWAPQVRNKNEAFEFLNHFVAQAAASTLAINAGQAHLLDLGCGVGGTALYVAKSLGVSITGITISTTQCELAKTHAEQHRLSDKVDFLTADFEALPPLPLFNAVYAIESFVHARDAAAFMTIAASKLPSGGRLIICDDFAQAEPSAQALYWIGRFKRGWHLNNVLSVAQTCKLAEQAGFRLVQQQDLSAYLRQFPTPLLWMLTHLTRIPLPWAYWDNLAGGTALQRCVQRGWSQYTALVWEKI